MAPKKRMFAHARNDRRRPAMTRADCVADAVPDLSFTAINAGGGGITRRPRLLDAIDHQSGDVDLAVCTLCIAMRRRRHFLFRS